MSRAGGRPIRTASAATRSRRPARSSPLGLQGGGQGVVQRHARHLGGVLHGQEQAGLGPLPRRHPEQLDAVEGDRTPGDVVAGPAHDHVGQRRLARPVRPHDGVDLAAGHRQVDAPQDVLTADSGPKAGHLKHAHFGTSTTTWSPSTCTL